MSIEEKADTIPTLLPNWVYHSAWHSTVIAGIQEPWRLSTGGGVEWFTLSRKPWDLLDWWCNWYLLFFLCISVHVVLQGRPEIPGVHRDTAAAGIRRRHFHRWRERTTGDNALQLQVPGLQTLCSDLCITHGSLAGSCRISAQLISILLSDEIQML